MQDLTSKAVTDARRRIFCAIDMNDLTAALELARKLEGLVGGIKLGKEFFTANGPQGVHAMAEAGLPVLLDLKFHDIPHTVVRAVAAAVELAPFMLTVHAAGGARMLHGAVDAAAAAAERHGLKRPLVVAVTVLTSLGPEDLSEIGMAGTLQDQVLRLAKLAQDTGLDGVVCSPREVEMVRAECGPDFKLVVPGIRPSWAAEQDQKRVMSPAEALARGADYLIIGRPISEARDPADAAHRIVREAAGA
jgi:orotidine-5'-phosphate decarboxylase